MNTLHKLLALVALALTSLTALAQDVVVDFVKEGTANSRVQTLIRGENVHFDFVGNEYEPYGAYLYCTWDIYSLTITAPRSIAVIEYQATPASGKNANLSASSGKISAKDADTRVWRGAADKITFWGTDQNTSCSITRLRLWFDAGKYNPEAPWEVSADDDNPYAADVNLADDDTDYAQKDRVYASVNILPRNGRGVPMAVVSAPQFKSVLQPYLEWKTQQGYEVTELYTDKVPGGKTGVELAHAIRQELMKMEPRPAYILLVGDVQDIPVFPGDPDVGPADLFYGEFTDDYYADAYVGRFTATTPEQLRPQLEKTQFMAALRPKDGEWLKHSLTVDNINEEIAVMRPASDMSLNYPLNFEGNSSQKIEASWQDAINTIINNGCSFVSYFGHGGPEMWSSSYMTSDANKLNNRGKYPVVFSITCHAGNFAYNPTCLAEAFMQHQDAGAVAVIASSRASRSDSNFRRFAGDRDGRQSASAGLLRSLFPCVGTDLSQRARTIGQALEISGLAVARNMPDDFYANSEMYNLLGDPTYQPYITTPKANKLHTATYNMTTGRNVTVSTVPEAMVCLSQGRKVIAAAVADTEGNVTLHIPAAAPTGDCMLYTSAPGYNDLWHAVTLTAGNGTDEVEEGVAAPLNITHTDIISVATVGTAVTDNWTDPRPMVSSTSPAQYLICAVNDLSNYAECVTGNKRWLYSDVPAEGIFIRDKYQYCSIVTTASPGKARRVSIDWLHPTGQGEVIGVYGSNYAYISTEQAWNGEEGDYLGTLVKGYNDELVIKGDYKYLLFRAEPHKQYPADEQSNVFIRSLKIDWEADLQRCAPPQITYADGEIAFRCATRGATYSYGIAPSKTKKGVFVVTATATAPGYAPSAPSTIEIDGSAIAKVRGDIDENGSISIADVTKLIQNLIKK